MRHEVFQGARESQGVREDGVERDGIVVRRRGGGVSWKGGGYELGEREWVDCLDVAVGDGAFFGIMR